MPFARFEDWDACILEQTKLGHDADSANKICGEIKNRAEKGILYKAEVDGLQILSKAEDPDIVLADYASWDMEDDEGDILTVEAQSKALLRFMNQAPEWQSITVNHKEFKLAQPLLKYVDSEGKEYFTHVNEKGTYLISKLRNDGLKTTQSYRKKALAGLINGYSITGVPLQVDPVNSKRILDLEYHSITLTEKGVMKPINPKSRNVQLISKGDCECDTSKCEGACCTFVTMPLAADTPDIKAYLTLHGLENKSDGQGGLYVKFPVACKAFDPETKLCASHDRRPEICRAYPRGESPFIEKAKCSLLLKREELWKAEKRKAADLAVVNDKGEFVVLPDSNMQYPHVLDEDARLRVEWILRRHGFGKGDSA